LYFFFQAEDGIRDKLVTGVQTCALPILFRALKFLKKPVVMVRFPGESHELSRSGQPWHRIERLEHIVGWFDKYLQGIHKPEYDRSEERRVGKECRCEWEAWELEIAWRVA